MRFWRRCSLVGGVGLALLAVMLQQNGTQMVSRPAGGAVARLRDVPVVCCFGPAASECGGLTGWSAAVAPDLSSARWRGLVVQISDMEAS
jgi:hypothetical protein